MKNIHIIPTDKPSRVYTNMQGILSKDELKIRLKNYNIYITSDEEIKEGDWFITTDTNEIHKSDWVKFHFDNGKKIILTTDLELQKDGVQPIDDEFLEWFVKNPSCEWVEVEDVYKKFLNGDKRSVSDFRNKYKIIIPKEEQSTKDRILSETPDEVKQRVRDRANLLVRKQETVEEATEKWIRQPKLISDRESFVAGVRWDQERSYSEVELFINEVKDKIDLFEHSVNQNSYISDYITEWFEKFKKK